MLRHLQFCKTAEGTCSASHTLGDSQPRTPRIPRTALAATLYDDAPDRLPWFSGAIRGLLFKKASGHQSMEAAKTTSLMQPMPAVS